jgi:heptosyltransferase-2
VSSRIKDVLIVKCSARGDVLRATSLLGPLKSLMPCRVFWLTSAGAGPLLRGNPFIERVFTLGKGRPPRGAFDLVLSLEESRPAAEAAARACRGELVGVVVRDGSLGYTPSSACVYDMSLLNPDRARADALKRANRLGYARLCLGLLGDGARGLPAPPPVLRLSEAEISRARGFARAHGLEPGEAVGFNPGAGRRWPSKRLSVEASARLIRALGRPVLLFGGPRERSRNAAILRLAPEAIAPGPWSLRGFCSLVGLCGALVSTDSLAFHVGTALGVGVVGLVGPTSAAELDAFGRGAVLTPPGGCGCFYRLRCSRPGHCLGSIPPEAVAAEVRRLLGERRI